jgi:lysosome membrane protein 2
MNDINGSLCYNITILTGKNADVSNLSKVIAVDGLNYNKHWVHESSMPLKGSDGSQFEPYCKRERTLRIFAPDMCRSFSLEYKRDNIVENVKTYEYHLAKNIFSTNSSLNPENEGFCGQDCLGDGVFNMSQCTGMSSFISLPHFLNSDVKFLNAVNGLKPDETKHDFVYNIEPVTGVPVSVNARLQISFYLYHHEELGIVSDAKELLFPTMWIDESVILHPRLLAQFTQAANFVSLIEIVPIILILIGVLMICITVFFNVYGYCKRNKEYSIDKITLENSTQENTNFI